MATNKKNTPAKVAPEVVDPWAAVGESAAKRGPVKGSTNKRGQEHIAKIAAAVKGKKSNVVLDPEEFGISTDSLKVHAGKFCKDNAGWNLHPVKSSTGKLMLIPAS